MPNFEFTNMHAFQIQSGDLKLKIDADKSQIFSERQRQYFDNIKFHTFERNELQATGRADEGTMETDSSNMEIMGNISFESMSENANLETDYLYYSNKNRLVTGRESSLTIIKQNDDIIEGKDLEFNLRTQTLILKKDVEITIEEEESGESIPDETNEE